MEWTWALRKLELPPNTLFFFARGLPLPLTRTNLVKDALKAECKWIFFLDSDVILPSNALNTLLSHGLPICSGLYRAHKREGFSYAVWMKVGENQYAPVGEWVGTLIPVDVTGLGCCLIRSEVFQRVPEPWFEWGDISEDFYFFEKAKKHGFQCVIDTSIKCSHVGLLKIQAENGTVRTLEV